MNNYEKLVSGMSGLIVNPKTQIDDNTLRMIACPFESVEDPDALEIEGCPSEKQCAACKRQWLAKEA